MSPAAGPYRRLRAARLLADPGRAAVPDGSVLVSDGRIVAAGPDAEVPCPPGAEEITFPDGTILPGLIDAHVHLSFSPAEDILAQLARETAEQQISRALANARRMAAAGITTVLDRGARADVAFAISAESVAGPARGSRVLVAGAPITPSRGHVHFLGGAADGVTGVQRAVHDLVSRGAHVIKIIATGGSMTAGTDPRSACYPAEVLAAAAAEAHQLGRSITAHAHGVPGMRAAVRAGIDAVEHGTMLGPDGQWAFDDELARELVATGTRVVPTAAAASRYELAGRSWAEALPNSGTSALVRTQNAGRLLAAGVHLVAGTDAGVPHTDFADELFLELEAYVAVGMPAADAIATATTRAAAHVGLPDSVGQLRPGMAADVLVVGGDPLADIRHLRQTQYVLRDGRPLPVEPPAAPPW